MFKLYRKSQEIQYNWIRNHPFQYIALNAILLAGWIGYTEYMDRRDLRKYTDDFKARVQKESP